MPDTPAEDRLFELIVLSFAVAFQLIALAVLHFPLALFLPITHAMDHIERQCTKIFTVMTKVE